MSAVLHLDNANFLRELAEDLPRLRPEEEAIMARRAALLQRLADQELAEAGLVESARATVAAARADTRPGFSVDAVRALLRKPISAA